MNKPKLLDQVRVTAALRHLNPTGGLLGPVSSSKPLPDMPMYSDFGGLSTNPGPLLPCTRLGIKLMTARPLPHLRLHFARVICIFFRYDVASAAFIPRLASLTTG
jgi:hypothetical protein